MTEHKNIFIHHVFFWLKNPDSKADETALIAGLKKLSKVETIRSFHIGKPAGTDRDVIERSYSISWLLIFDNLEDEESYQPHPLHKKFIEECSHLWNRVVVHDSIDAE
ncbi:MAG TPA: Dabb family protein [Puia sp.]|nr:Dabb family protein [Puia sp.]